MSSMQDLQALMQRVVPGVVVHTTNHDYIKDSGTSRVTRISDNLYGTGRPGYESKTAGSGKLWHYVWPEENTDFEVLGNELRIYNQKHSYTGGRAIILTLRFEF